MLLNGEKMSENYYWKWRSRCGEPTVVGENGRDAGQMIDESNT
jgi:hypothetical protein